MGEIVEFVPKSELKRARLIREARAIYDSIFPPIEAIGERPDDRANNVGATGLHGPAPTKGNVPTTGRS
jgi:hypothetical protein